MSLLPLFVTTGCAPVVTIPPPVPLAAPGALEVGTAASVGGSDQAMFMDGLFFARVQATDSLELGLLGGWMTMTWAGGATIKYTRTHGHLVVGGQFTAGTSWTDLSAPVAYHLGRDIWAYTAPSVGVRHIMPIRLPVGLSVPLGSQFGLALEGGIGRDPFRWSWVNDVHADSSYDGRFWWVGSSLSWQPRVPWIEEPG